MRTWRSALIASAFVMSAAWTTTFVVQVSAQAHSPWNVSYFPNVPLTTQDGERIGFYDLIKGKTVAIELMYTSCDYACPLETARLAQVQTMIGDRMGRDIFFYSISIDPKHDTPAVLKAYAEKYHAGPGWKFLTGKPSDIELLSRKLGLYSPPNPKDKDGHTPTLLIGNEPSGQWTRGSALDNARLTATMIGNWFGGYQNAGPVRSYADATPMPKFTTGEYLFAKKCSVCHSLGGEPKLGPDLTHVVHMRDREWLARYISSPDEMLRAGDPIAKALTKSYQEIRMPNLGLSRADIADILGYLESRATPAK